MFINGAQILTAEAPQTPAAQFLVCGNLTAATTTAAGGVFKVQNTYGQDLVVTDVLIDVKTGSTGAATIDIGVHADGTASNDTLIDGMNAQTVRIHDNRVQNGTNGGVAVWKKGEYVVATASATTAGMVGTYKILAVAR